MVFGFDVVDRALGKFASKSEQIRETHTVMSAELQGYLSIADGTPAARVVVPAQGYEKKGVRFVAVEKKEVPAITRDPEAPTHDRV